MNYLEYLQDGGIGLKQIPLDSRVLKDKNTKLYTDKWLYDIILRLHKFSSNGIKEIRNLWDKNSSNLLIDDLSNIDVPSNLSTKYLDANNYIKLNLA